MTKTQMSNKAAALLAEHKANKKLTEAMTELFEQYLSTAKGGVNKRDKVITVDGNEYVWCNRHEIYEPSTNFGMQSDRKGGTKYQDACKLAHKYWSHMGVRINAAAKEFEALLDEDKFQEAKAAKGVLDELKVTRAGRYNFDDNALQFADIEDYEYDYSKFIEETK